MIEDVPFGRGFVASILAQITLPVVLFTAFALFSPPNQDIEPLGPSFSRSLDFMGMMFWLILLTTFVAGSFGLTRFFTSPRPYEENPRA
jgi:hypothetical protein